MSTIPVVMQRTEDQKVQMAPMRVSLGSKEYDIKPLKIGKAQKWRDDLIIKVKEIATRMSVTPSLESSFVGSLAFVFLQFPKDMVEIVRSYAPYLPWDDILGDNEELAATEEQIAVAFGQIVQVAFPFVGELKAISQTLGIPLTLLQSAKSTK